MSPDVIHLMVFLFLMTGRECYHAPAYNLRRYENASTLPVSKVVLLVAFDTLRLVCILVKLPITVTPLVVNFPLDGTVKMMLMPASLGIPRSHPLVMLVIIVGSLLAVAISCSPSCMMILFSMIDIG